MPNNLINQLKSGNSDTFYSIYREYRMDFIRWADLKYSVCDDDAKDIYQDLFIIFYRNINEGKLIALTSDVKTYLFAIGSHLLLNHIKKSNRTVTLSNDELINGYDNPFEMTHQKEHNKQIVEQYLSKLPEKEQEILRLYYMEELDMKTIAQKMGYKNADVAKKKKYEVFKKLAMLVRSSLKTFMII